MVDIARAREALTTTKKPVKLADLYGKVDAKDYKEP